MRAGPVRITTTVLYPPAADPAERTYCVLGVPRGGTRMTSGLLGALGVFMGDNLPYNGEDPAFTGHRGDYRIFTDPRHPARQRQIDAMLATVDARNAAHRLWGWKDPLSIFYIAALLDRLRNPHFIFVSRDPGAAAQRESAEVEFATASPLEGSRALQTLRRITDSYSLIAQFLAQAKKPTLMMSYERALRHPAETAAALVDFTGLPAPGFGDWATTYIRPGD